MYESKSYEMRHGPPLNVHSDVYPSKTSRDQTESKLT